MTRRCQAAGCDAILTSDEPACTQHWEMVPAPLRSAFYRARVQAVNALNHKLATQNGVIR